MGLFNLKPTRENAKPAVVVADLDKLIAEPVAFRFGGKTHLIKPMSTSEFFSVTAKLGKMEELRSKENLEVKELIDAYYGLFSAMCTSLKRSDIESMSQVQVGALFQLMLDCIMGRAQGDST
jgi:hypothetical protein